MAHHHHAAPDWEQKCGSLAAELTAWRNSSSSSSASSSVHHYSSSFPSSGLTLEQATTREVLVQKILASYENTLSMLNTQTMMPAQHHHHHRNINHGLVCDEGDIRTVVMLKSSPPGSRSGSPGSEDSDRNSSHDLFKDTTSPPSRKGH
ncbi:unnamed protein product [Linum trigynum]|uniref:Uncharacterized protein n=1 Tax=Linum trigynum TaxID=586398 RepID=A0AAV2FA95_9ROSI